MTEAVYSASELARGTVPSKAIGHLGFCRPRRQNWHSLNPPLAWEKPPSPSAEISVAATCVGNTIPLKCSRLCKAFQRQCWLPVNAMLLAELTFVSNVCVQVDVMSTCLVVCRLLKSRTRSS